jgi:hypothetical protein
MEAVMPRSSKQVIRGIGVALAIALAVTAVTAFGIAAAVSSSVEHSNVQVAHPASARPTSPSADAGLRLSDHQQLRTLVVNPSRDRLR